MPAQTHPTPCPVCGGEMYDNRENKRNPKAPDAKCKDKACEGVLWPPRNGKKPVGAVVPPQDDRSHRIERQHSQEMALRYFTLGGKLPSTKELREMTSWFQRDVGHSPEKTTEPEPELGEPF